MSASLLACVPFDVCLLVYMLYIFLERPTNINLCNVFFFFFDEVIAGAAFSLL